jgi:hypothetical protein
VQYTVKMTFYRYLTVTSPSSNGQDHSQGDTITVTVMNSGGHGLSRYGYGNAHKKKDQLYKNIKIL